MSDPVDATASTTALPTGTVTFVMTDIEGSTRLIQALGDRYPQLLAEHYRLLREAFGSAGVEVGSEGDALFYAFADAQRLKGLGPARAASGTLRTADTGFEGLPFLVQLAPSGDVRA